MWQDISLKSWQAYVLNPLQGLKNLGGRSWKFYSCHGDTGIFHLILILVLYFIAVEDLMFLKLLLACTLYLLTSKVGLCFSRVYYAKTVVENYCKLNFKTITYLEQPSSKFHLTNYMKYYPPKALWMQTENMEDSQTTSRSIMESGSRYRMTQWDGRR